MVESIIQENDTVISICLSKNDKYLLVNTSFTRPELHLWNIENKEIIGK